jgi:hypothetical protein
MPLGASLFTWRRTDALTEHRGEIAWIIEAAIPSDLADIEKAYA